MVRYLIGKILIALLALTATTVGALISASASDSIVMPFACKLDNGQPKLTSTAPKHHDIVGPHKQRSYTACRDGAGRDCQTMVVHNFDLRCEGKSIPWWKVAAQVRSKEVGRSWIESGRLNLLLKNRANSDSKRMAQFVLPPGFAPVAELGARLAVKPEAPPKPAAPTQTASKPASAIVTGATRGGKQTKVAVATENAIVVEPIPNASSVPALLDNRSALDPWQPVVSRTDATSQLGVAATGGGYSLLVLVSGLIATSLLGAFGWLMRQRYGLAVSSGPSQDTTHPPATGGFGPVFSKAAALFAFVPDLLSGLAAKTRARWLGWKWRNFTAARPWQWRNTSIANGARSAEALYEKAEIAVRTLGPVSALRDTLTSELKVVRQRLDALRGGPGEDARTARLASSLRSAVRDLERIGRIADSAASSLKNGRDDRTIPKTRAEAYEVLGVNPNASEASLKRTVDALRMGWHPDLAKDDADKIMREERTKQINIAWDLIVGKRAA
jgi:DnaJ-domain-containing protein 1